MRLEEIEDLFRSIRVWHRGTQRAPHKPLLVLLMLGRYARGGERLVRFADIDGPLRGLLARFGPERQSLHTEYPFWRLQSDKIWEVHGAESASRRNGQTDIKKSELLKWDVRGGFPEELYKALLSNPKAIPTLINVVLSANFPDSQHEAVRAEIGAAPSGPVK